MVGEIEAVSGEGQKKLRLGGGNVRRRGSGGGKKRLAGMVVVTKGMVGMVVGTRRRTVHVGGGLDVPGGCLMV